MSTKYGSFSSKLLEAIGDATGFFSWPLEGTTGWRYKQIKNHKNKYIYDTIFQLKRAGLVKEISNNGRRFIELTKKGEIENFLIKARLTSKAKKEWDGKWRLIIFDIPEDARDKRDKFRKLLKENGFIFLQASVFISPYQLSRRAIVYLKETKLINYIRLARIDELDDDRDLKKRFKL